MRTTLDLPEDLLNEAQRVLGFKSKTDTVVLSLTELVRRRRIDELKELAGKVELELDVGASRRRSASTGKGAGRKPRPLAGAPAKAKSRRGA
ncbi:MAG: type II toxin-antitoxin system VapB family antitoxin [Deltaproteobacteria bacterium]